MNSTEIFQLGLGLSAPFKVTKVELQTDSEQRKSLTLFIDFERGSKFIDKHGVLCKVHDTVERT
jgi:transposase